MNQINKNIAIAISMLEETRTDRYGNGRITHENRNFVTATVTELLDKVLINLQKVDTLIIPKNTDSINPPEEP